MWSKVATITKVNKNAFVLKLYKNGIVIFEKEYSTFIGAKIAQEKLIRKYLY